MPHEMFVFLVFVMSVIFIVPTGYIIFAGGK